MGENKEPTIMESLGLDFKPAKTSTGEFQKTVENLRKEISLMELVATQSAKNINAAFKRELGDMGFKEAKKMFAQLEEFNKPIEVKVVTDKAEREMVAFAESLGIKLDSALKKELKNLGSSFITNFYDMDVENSELRKRFDRIAQGVTEAYMEAMQKYQRKLDISMFKDSDDMKIYEHIKGMTLKMGTDVDWFKGQTGEIDGFAHALRNLVTLSKDAGVSLDSVSGEIESMYNIDMGKGLTDMAARITRAVENVRAFKKGFMPAGGISYLGERQLDYQPLGSNLPFGRQEAEQFVEESLAGLAAKLMAIQYESEKAAQAMKKIGTVAPSEEIKTTTSALESLGFTTDDFDTKVTQTWYDATENAHKYTETLKDVSAGLTAVSTFLKDEEGEFRFAGLTVTDKEQEQAFLDMEKLHAQALKDNAKFDAEKKRQQQEASDTARRLIVEEEQERIRVTTEAQAQIERAITNSNEDIQEQQNRMSKLNAHKQEEMWKKQLAREEENVKKQYDAVNEVSIAQMQSKAASIEQRLYSRGLTDEYYEQARTLRDQLTVMLERLRTEGNLTDEEKRQTIEIEKQLKLLKAQSDEALSDSKKKQSTSINEEWDRRAGWFISGRMFFSTINAAKEAKRAIKDVEMGMIEIQRVMTDSTFSFEEYRDQLFKLGVEYGQTFENVQQIALRWAQSGYNVADSLKLTQTSLLALNTAELDAKNATESMIGIMAQWELEATDMALVMDKVNITADRFSVTSQDLVDGLLRSSGAARIMNLSLDETIGLLTVMREASGRTGQEVGNALNSILSYIQRPTSIRTLEGMGISMFADEAKTQFRNVLEIFKDIAVNWNTLSADIQDGFVQAADDAGLFNEELAAALGTQEEWNDLQKRDIAQASAGVYRRNYLIALIERLSDVQGVLNNLMDAEGHSMRENLETMEALDKKQTSLKTSAQALAVAAGDAGLADAFKALATGGAKVLDLLNSMPKGIKDMVLATTTLFIAVKALGMGMKVFGFNTPFALQAITSGVDGLKIAFLSLKDVMLAAKTTSLAFLSANLPLLALTAIVGGIMAWRNAVKAHREEQEKAIEVAKERISTLEEEKEGLRKLAQEYETLKGKEQSLRITTDEKIRLREVQRELVDLYGVSITGIDAEGRAYADSTDIIWDRVEALERMTEAEKERLRETVLADDKKAVAKIKESKERIEEIRKEILAAQQQIKELEAELASEETDDIMRKVIERDIQVTREKLVALRTESDEVNDVIEEYSRNRSQLLKSVAIDTANILNEGGQDISDNIRAYAVAMAESLATTGENIEDLEDTLKGAITNIVNSGLDEWIEKYNAALSEGDSEGIDKYSKVISDMTNALSQGRPELDGWIASIEKLYPSSAQMANATFNLTGALKSLNQSARDSTGDLETLNKTLEDVRNGQALSAKTVLELMEKYELSAEQIKEVAGGYTVEIDVLENLRKAKITTFEIGAETEQKTAEIVKKNVEARIKAYGLEIDQLNNTTDARAAMLNMAEGKASGRARTITSGFNIKDEQRELEQYAELSRWFYKKEKATAEGLSSEYEKASADLEKYQQNTEFYTNLLKNIGTTSGKISSASSAASKQENELLSKAIRLLEHRKRMSEETQESIRAEIADLERINTEYVRTVDERMDMDERIYAARKRLQDKMLQDSTNWINREKSLGRLSVEDEIAGWERVYKNQYDNSEARRQAEVNLYTLRNQIVDESYAREERHIQHMTKLGVWNIEEQIKGYRKLYEVKAKTEQEEQARIENLFSLYKSLLSDQQQEIKEAYDERIKQIDDEADRQKEAQEEIIKGIDKEIEAINRREQAYDHDRRMEDLEEELAYWQVRTSEQARQKVVEIEKRMREELHSRDVELEKQGLEDKKQIAQDEIKTIEDTAKEEKEKWEKSYKGIETFFKDEHSINMIALAAAMAGGMYTAFEENYLNRMKSALTGGDFETAEKIAGSIPDYAAEAKAQTYDSDNARIYRLASDIVDLKRQYEHANDIAAHQRALPIYAELEKLSPHVANMLHQNNYVASKKYIDSLPKFHTGAKTLSYGMAMYKPGELIFPPGLSTKLEGLIAVLNQRPISQSTSHLLTDNRKEVRIDRLLNIEQNYMEDDVDSNILARQLQHVLTSM